MRNTDTGDIQYLRVINQDLFCFSGVDVDPARDNHVAEAVGDVDVSVCVHISDFAEGKNAWRDMGRCGFLRIIVINHTTACGVLKIEFAFRVGRQWFAIVIKNLRCERWHAPANRARMLEPLCGGDHASGSDFAGTISIDKQGPPPFNHGTFDINRALSASVANLNHA